MSQGQALLLDPTAHAELLAQSWNTERKTLEPRSVLQAASLS